MKAALGQPINPPPGPDPGRPADARLPGAARSAAGAGRRSDPLVLGAGGTSLTASHTTGAWIGETAWGLPYGDTGSAFQASGGGFSAS